MQQALFTKSDSLFECASNLIQRQSVTPDDAGCQRYIAARLKAMGFTIEHLCHHGVSNLVAYMPGKPKLGFSGHTDVVPAGEHWQFSPFQLTEQGGRLYGRGIADMKGAIAAFITALEQLPKVPEGVMVLLTSDEEGEAEFGSSSIVNYLALWQKLPPWVLVGEPTAKLHSGDTIRNGRRGAISGELKLWGQAGHVAYQRSADNLLHQALALGNQLASLQWDQGCEDVPGTAFHITGIEPSPWLDNVTASSVTLRFNVRYSHRFNAQTVANKIESVIAQSGVNYQIEWGRDCQAYYCNEHSGNSLIRAVEQAVIKVSGRFPLLSSAGGSSDGRFFAKAGAQVVELGLPNATIHQANECVEAKELYRLQQLYFELLKEL
ncbi:succinyl-diaminopimelate desuccinylase [Ferrimonas aestuarii]|uniref:Succinyl-diaminopimelate desuccinylase n=1 Tax=Ferrimonas aestuarii TaxID=2569539 RepID=A0A4U1BPD8_9GAMM|nr:succinyl-diaminopimelate desuccinylase [Ferrimonas aestuarii]TKB54269.1 succinyl-diaminopimelate desuccinylase [Ferrimonas aestuarii]